MRSGALEFGPLKYGLLKLRTVLVVPAASALWGVLSLWSGAGYALEQATRPAYTPPPSAAVSSGSVVQVILSLFLVLAAVVLVAWLLKRLNLPQYGTGNVLKVIGGVAVGQRERIVLVEVNDTWLVIGVAPGQVRTLHTLPKGSAPLTQNSAATPDGKFQAWLKHMMEKRDAR